MSTQQIPQNQWNNFLAEFSAHNQKRNVTIDLESNELGPQRLVDSRPLLSVETDLKDKLDPVITVIAGDPEGGEPAALTHQVMDPKAIWIKESDGGEAEALDIEASEGRTIIQFVS